jgi:hypothetical protein
VINTNNKNNIIQSQYKLFKMNEHLAEILTRGGVKLPQNGEREQTETSASKNGIGKTKVLNERLSILESWLGFPSAKDWEEEEGMMEDAAPFYHGFCRAVEKFLIDVWNPEEA